MLRQSFGSLALHSKSSSSISSRTLQLSSLNLSVPHLFSSVCSPPVDCRNNWERTVEKPELLTCFALVCPFLPSSDSFFVSFWNFDLEPLSNSLAIFSAPKGSRRADRSVSCALESVKVFERESSATDLALLVRTLEARRRSRLEQFDPVTRYLFDDGAQSALETQISQNSFNVPLRLSSPILVL